MDETEETDETDGTQETEEETDNMLKGSSKQTVTRNGGEDKTNLINGDLSAIVSQDGGTVDPDGELSSLKTIHIKYQMDRIPVAGDDNIDEHADDTYIKGCLLYTSTGLGQGNITGCRCSLSALDRLYIQ